MEDYDKLVEKCQSGEIDMLEFILAQDNLASLYVEDMQAQGITPDEKSATEWLHKYEYTHLYQ